MTGERGGARHISAYVPGDLDQWLNGHDGSKSETIVKYLNAIRNGDMIPKDSVLPPLDSAKLTGVDLDNELKRKKLEAYDPDKELWRAKMAADINLKTLQGKMTAAAFDQLMGGLTHGTRRRWLYPSDNGDSLEFFCPDCYRTVASIKTLNDYMGAKQQLAHHCIEKHGYNIRLFNHATGEFFNHFEVTLLGGPKPLSPPKE